MEDYLQMLKYLLVNGDRQFNDRTEQYMIGRNSYQLRHDLRNGFPALTTKRLFFNSSAEEMFWIMAGKRDVKTLVDKNVPIWNDNAYDFYLKRHQLKGKIKKNTKELEEGFAEYMEKIKSDPEFARVEGDMGPIYGFQLRHKQRRDGGEIDQLQNVLSILRKDPGSRYAIMDAWDVEDVTTERMALAPCHFWYQFAVWENKFLDLHMVQRSCDSFLGVPFNRSGPAILAHLVAKELGLIPRESGHTLINVHIYNGVPPRADFLKNNENLKEFRNKVREATKPEDYMQIRQWYINKAPEEGKLHERKDHIPFVLEQLSKTPLELPRLKIKSDLPLFEMIERPALEVLELEDYKYHKWDSRARMEA